MSGSASTMTFFTPRFMWKIGPYFSERRCNVSCITPRKGRKPIRGMPHGPGGNGPLLLSFDIILVKRNTIKNTKQTPLLFKARFSTLLTKFTTTPIFVWGQSESSLNNFEDESSKNIFSFKVLWSRESLLKDCSSLLKVTWACYCLDWWFRFDYIAFIVILEGVAWNSAHRKPCH